MTDPEPKMPQDAPAAATHLAVPTDLIGAVLEILQNLPWKESNRVISALTQCQGISLPDSDS